MPRTTLCYIEKNFTVSQSTLPRIKMRCCQVPDWVTAKEFHCFAIRNLAPSDRESVCIGIWFRWLTLLPIQDALLPSIRLRYSERISLLRNPKIGTIASRIGLYRYMVQLVNFTTDSRCAAAKHQIALQRKNFTASQSETWHHRIENRSI